MAALDEEGFQCATCLDFEVCPTEGFMGLGCCHRKCHIRYVGKGGCPFHCQGDDAYIRVLLHLQP